MENKYYACKCIWEKNKWGVVCVICQFLNAEKSTGFSENNELGKIKKEYEKDFGANTVLMLQIELTRTIADRWFAEAEIGFIPRIRGKMWLWVIRKL